MMDAPAELYVPNAAEDEIRVPSAVARIAAAIGALAAAEGLVSPKRLQTALSVAGVTGSMLGEPSLMQVLVLRALSSPPSPRVAFTALKPATATLSAPERAALMIELSPLVSGDAKPSVAALAAELAAALGVPVPGNLRHDAGGRLDGFGTFADRAMRLVRSSPVDAPVVAAAREFAAEFGEGQLLPVVADAQRTGDQSRLTVALRLALDGVRERVTAVVQAAHDQMEALSTADELDKVADRIERDARQRYAAITRRATMLKRHIREDLTALTEDAAEEFETDFRRLAERKRGWFSRLIGRIDTMDLNDRLVVKNPERRYSALARRYQDQLDLLGREISEFADEFTRIGDEALRPMARHEFRGIAPHPALELRVKAAADRASTRVLAAGMVGAAASGTALYSGVIATAAIVSAAATPAGVVVLGAVALAGVWKMFAKPGERSRRDLRERPRALEDGLRSEIMSNLPQFEATVDAIIGRFSAVVVPDIARPRIEAERIREIASAHRIVAKGVAQAANARIERLFILIQD